MKAGIVYALHCAVPDGSIPPPLNRIFLSQQTHARHFGGRAQEGMSVSSCGVDPLAKTLSRRLWSGDLAIAFPECEWKLRVDLLRAI
jgi:hypothetical protein